MKGSSFMRFFSKIGQRLIIIILLTLLLLVAFGTTVFIISGQRLKDKDIVLGVTFSQKYAQELGLDWQEVYTAILNNLKVRHLRLPAYWPLIEVKPGQYFFEDLDRQLALAEQTQTSVILVIGRRLPRWPECHEPAWVKYFPEKVKQERILRLLRVLVERYQGQSAIIAWQVDNEPLFSIFGLCPPPDEKFLRQEINLVRSLDQRPIVITDSGELSSWLKAAALSDVLGISMYKVTWNKYLGYFYYPLPPVFYQTKAKLVKELVQKVIVTELQAEPWLSQPIEKTPLSKQFESMNIKRLRSNIDYVRRVGFSEVYLWGVEWWYWLKMQGDDSLWQEAKRIFDSR